MAKFKVGQRARLVHITESWKAMRGLEATLLERFDTEAGAEAWRLCIDGHGTHSSRGLPWRALASEMEPLTDPKADAFLESIKRLKPYDEPKVPAKTESPVTFPSEAK